MGTLRLCVCGGEGGYTTAFESRNDGLFPVFKAQYTQPLSTSPPLWITRDHSQGTT